MNIFRTFWKSGRELFEELFVLAIANVLWVLINLPLALALLFLSSAGTGVLLIGLLVGVLSFGPANAGLYAIAERVTDGRTSTWRHFFEGLREYAVLSWKVYGLWTLGLIIILFNLQFYNLNSGIVFAMLSVVFLYFAVVWFSLLIYLGPLMRLQTDKRLRTIARNAALMTFGRPIFTLVTLIMMALIVVLSIWLPILPLLATFSFLALWSFRATLTLIAEAEARRAAAADQQANLKPAEKGRGGQIRPRE
jgi:uncharacterized membrane protein YesL